VKAFESMKSTNPIYSNGPASPMPEVRPEAIAAAEYIAERFQLRQNEPADASSSPMGEALREFLSTLFGIPAESSDEAFTAAARAFTKQLGLSLFNHEDDAVIRGMLEMLQADLDPSASDINTARLLGLTPEAWHRDACRYFAALAAEADLSPSDRAVAKQLGLSPAQMAFA
jgi:hypothetical protein